MIRRLTTVLLLVTATALSLHPTFAQDVQTHDRRAPALTSPARGAIWRSLGKRAMKTSIPEGLNIGELVPSTVHVLPFDRRLRQKVSAIRPYSYALLQGQVLIVDPRSKKIVFIVSK